MAKSAGRRFPCGKNWDPWAHDPKNGSPWKDFHPEHLNLSNFNRFIWPLMFTGRSAALVERDQMSIWVMKCRVLCVSAVLRRIVCAGYRNLFIQETSINSENGQTPNIYDNEPVFRPLRLYRFPVVVVHSSLQLTAFAGFFPEGSCLLQRLLRDGDRFLFPAGLQKV